jgi:hypothetical protein
LKIILSENPIGRKLLSVAYQKPGGGGSVILFSTAELPMAEFKFTGFSPVHQPPTAEGDSYTPGNGALHVWTHHGSQAIYEIQSEFPLRTGRNTATIYEVTKEDEPVYHHKLI